MPQLDMLLLVPHPPPEAYLMNRGLRQTFGPLTMKLLSAGYELQSFVGRDLGFDKALDPHNPVTVRSSTAVALSTSLERAGLSWATVDPGSRNLNYWQEQLNKYRLLKPICVGISTTYFISSEWLEALIRMCRETIPDAKIVVGGYMYGTSSREFLSLSADVLCVSEAESRLPEIVRAVKNDGDLKDISGLYIRLPNNTLELTSAAKPAPFRDLPQPDWMLSLRMEPPVDPEKQAIHIGLETQRGCVFKCHFCTYRTLSRPNALTVQDAVAAIINTGKFSRGSQIFLADATATFPRERWQEIMKSLAARGGAPHPLTAYARVSDVTDEIAMLMAAANVQYLFIGQESGDQRIIKAMRKGTDISHVRPCIEALGKSGIEAIFGFIHGFPGETRETMQNTRDLICHLNDGFEHKPVVLQYQLNPFLMQDMASISVDDKLIGQPVAPSVVSDEMLATFIATAKVAHAPLMLGIGPSHLKFPPSFLSGISRSELFRWSKILQRGVSMFLESHLSGKALDLSELKSIRSALIEPMTSCGLRARVRTGRVPSHLKKVFFAALGRELEVEHLSGVGTLTRVALFRCDLGATGRLSSAVQTLFQPKRERVPSSQVEGLAAGLMDETIQAPKERNLIRKQRLRAS